MYKPKKLQMGYKFPLAGAFCIIFCTSPPTLTNSLDSVTHWWLFTVTLQLEVLQLGPKGEEWRGSGINLYYLAASRPTQVYFHFFVELSVS